METSMSLPAPPLARSAERRAAGADPRATASMRFGCAAAEVLEQYLLQEEEDRDEQRVTDTELRQSDPIIHVRQSGKPGRCIAHHDWRQEVDQLVNDGGRDRDGRQLFPRRQEESRHECDEDCAPGIGGQLSVALLDEI